MTAVEAKAEAAYQIALVKSEALRLLAASGDRELIKLAWLCGYFEGRIHGVQETREIFRE